MPFYLFCGASPLWLYWLHSWRRENACFQRGSAEGGWGGADGSLLSPAQLSVKCQQTPPAERQQLSKGWQKQQQELNKQMRVHWWSMYVRPINIHMIRLIKSNAMNCCSWAQTMKYIIGLAHLVCFVTFHESVKRKQTPSWLGCVGPHPCQQQQGHV